MTLSEGQRRIVLLVAAVLLLPVVGSTIAGSAIIDTQVVIGGVLLSVIATAAIAFSLYRPAAATVIAAAAVCGYLLLGLNDGPILIVTPLAAFVAGLLVRPSRHAVPLAAAVLLLVGGVLGRTAMHDTASWRETSWQAGGTVAVLCASAAIAWWLRSWQDIRRERHRRGATEERLAMARDLHDHVGHGLAVIAMQAGVALHVLESNPQAVRTALEAIRDTSRLSLDSLRSQLSALTSSGESAESPLAPRAGLAQLPELAARVRAAGLAVDLRVPDALAVPAEVDHAAYLIVQEAATNALRHAEAHRLTITVEDGPDGLSIEVRDDGAGTPTEPAAGSGLGLASMTDRAVSLGGSLRAGPEPGGGFALRAWLPRSVREAERAAR